MREAVTPVFWHPPPASTRASRVSVLQDRSGIDKLAVRRDD
ncbi:hypothetical protein ACFW9O_25400 [Streptomyces sp. NPDC059499]